MQLAVIDDLIEQQKAIIRKYPDNKDKAIAYLLGFIDCAKQAQVINNADPDLKRTAAGKTVAWINYMTNVNRTFGNFTPGMSESFMVLNRNYSMNANQQIEDLTNLS